MKKIGIIAALESEVMALRDELKDSKVEHIAGADFHVGKIGKYEVVLMRCGVGKVAAGAGAQAMILAYKPDVIINTGCAGAIDTDLKVGDMVLSDSTVQWDMDTTAIGDPRGYISSLDTVEIKANKDLVDLIEKYIPRDTAVKRGIVCSGDQFVSNPTQRKTILDNFPNTKCAEMEGAAIGQVCAQNDVPFCVVRCMSDTADGNSQTDYPTFSKLAGIKSAGVLIKMLND